MKTLEATTDAPPGFGAFWFLLCYHVAAILLAGTAIWWASEDKSWGAVWIAFIGAPIANGSLMVLGVVLGWMIRKNSPAHRKMPLYFPIVLAPVLGIIMTFVAILCMELHGC
jgi:hypothetical protein